VIDAGANVLVAGTSVFGCNEGVSAAMMRLRPLTSQFLTPAHT